MYDLVIENGTLVTSQGEYKGKIAVKDGKIAAILSSESTISASEYIDAQDHLVMPGLVDTHVHCGHGTPERENFECVTKAAAAGGITTIVDMPLSEPSTVTVDALEEKKKSAFPQVVVDFSLYSGIIPHHMNDIEATFEAGAQCYKIFTCRCSNYPMTYDGLLLKGMKKIGQLGGMVCAHAENDTLIQELVDDFLLSGRDDAQAYLESHPEYSELEAVKRFIFLSSLVPNCKTHICHLSIASGAEALREARGHGITNITAETCPQYLALDEEDLIRDGALLKCDPPVRSRENVERLWEMVLNGTIDMIVSDHSPHSFEKKTPQNNNFWTVSEGCTGVQTLLPVVATEGRKRGLSWTQLVKLCATQPARRFGLGYAKGDIQIGYDADLILFDPLKEWVQDDSKLFYLNKWSPYKNKKFKGQIKRTIIRGKTVFIDGKIQVKPGYGHYYKMDIAAK
ncbi:allantoinase AllB [Aminobacterium sp. MB27-C1]|jgi:allantoinase|uniref:allantoinase AllB n=1 Tax=unclassified Aminobacterium TaxID=2685012 RepID=UPI001BCAEF58|nr:MULTISPECIES: allantoinase AllB [unclassified Aminobacterium]MEA4877660.1 allantoinase AllB [Aminobacterium sp.]WMI70781.1 allantoinase AllB [Aminobacterium sp. MB27-C1]